MVAKKPRRKKPQRNPAPRKYRVRQYEILEWDVCTWTWNPVGRVLETSPKYALEEFMAAVPGYNRYALIVEEIGTAKPTKSYSLNDRGMMVGHKERPFVRPRPSEMIRLAPTSRKR